MMQARTRPDIMYKKKKIRNRVKERRDKPARYTYPLKRF